MEDNKFKKTEYHLYNYKYIDTLNKLADIKIKKLENDISIKPINYSEKSSKTNKFSSDVENEIIRRDEEIYKRIEQLKKEKENRLIEKELIDTTLKLLKDDQRKLVELRYFSKPTRSWTSISQDLNQTIDSCIKIRRRVIAEIANNII